eukprot:TRINITY_DN25509_c0_g1_i1.p1 TRINITY_DN25509_c0_g1~~TRINITY_DN25509_c0_g1_i1.p1  ORF type:complete len:296 (+),score=32.66 TRINITY_DN25509_c0_g1_i1:57-890(+)
MQELNEGENAVLGTVAASVECVVLQPTLYLKNAAQQGLPLTADPRLLYRGLGAALCSEMGQMGVQFGCTSFMNRLIMGKDHGTRPMTVPEELGASLLGGSLAALYTSPCELVMIQQQRFGGTLLGTPAQVFRQHGFSNGIMRGVFANMGRDGIYVCGMLGVTPILQAKIVSVYPEMHLSVAGAWASSFSGVIAGVLSCPFDVVKTCMQGDLSREKYGGFMSTASKVASGGVRSLFAGVLWRAINITGTIGITNECCNRMGPYMFPAKFAASTQLETK